MNKLYSSILALCLFPAFLHAQIRKIDLVGYQGCGGVTLIPIPSFTQGYTGVTLYYDRLVAADTWQLEATQTYNSTTGSWQIYNGDDILQQTIFRVRALDEITGTIYTSNSVTVGPNTWNVDRGTSFFSVAGHWGGTCDSNSNYITAEMNYTVNGRPPYTIDYKRSDETNWKSVGQYVKGAFITGINPLFSYNVRITDVCGKVFNSGASLSIQTQYNIDHNATTCNDGQITLSASSDDRYSGIAPFTYALSKYQPSQGSLPTPVFGTNNVFSNLGPGVYYYYLKDACGNTTAARAITLGSGLLQATATAITPANECERVFSISAYNGTRPFKYGIKAPGSNNFTYSTDSAITITRDGTYSYRVISACGDTSSTNDYFVSIPYPNASATNISAFGACLKSIQLTAAGSYGPYTYAIRPQGSNATYIYQSSDLFTSLSPGIYELSVMDRCGRTNWVPASIDISANPCLLRTDTGTYESAATNSCTSFSGEAWIDVKDDADNLVYSINPHNNILNDVCWGVNIVQSARKDSSASNPLYFLNRNFYIQPGASDPIRDSVSIRLFFTNDELNQLMTAAGITSPDSLRILKKSEGPGAPVDLDVTNDGATPGNLLTVIKPTIVSYGSDWFMQFNVHSFSEFNTFIGSTSIPLPVKWLSIAAKTANTAIILDWSTEENPLTDHYEIEWSTDGIVYSQLTTMTAKHNTSANNYQYQHTSPAKNINYYRIKQSDKDGSFNLSKVVTANPATTTNPTPAITVFPNPAGNWLTVKNSASSAFNHARIIDATGRTVLQQRLTTGAISIDVHILTKGWYILRLEGNTPQQISFLKIDK